MAIGGLNHVTINAADLPATRRFWVEVLGLTDGDRPPLGFPGHWLWAGGAPLVHLVGAREGDDARPPRTPGPTGLLDHVAFSADDLPAMRARLSAAGVAFREQVVPRDGRVQLFLRDPNGVQVELNFPPG